ncbi:MAG: hypothetical protein IT371_28390 [Deltaproteobacteria bacterium]|nr:hypothetical protein [Deltaproteobacteria bacterium]
MLRLVVALPPEARPLVRHYGLKPPAEPEPFPIYQGEGIWLVVSGLGKLAAAAATSYLYLRSGGQRQAAWLNLGVGGHREHPLGTGLLAHKVMDEATGWRWYPPQLPELAIPSASVLTVERPETEYAGPWLYEMEASGFFVAASRFAAPPLVHCYKVVSDNLHQRTEKVDAALVERLIDERLGELDLLVRQLAALARDPASAGRNESRR